MRRSLLPVLALLAALLAPAAASAAATTPRVVGGAPASSADAPWQALVLPGGYLCGGAILDPTHVATAAHCVYDEVDQAPIDPSTVSVRVGITDRTQAGGETRGVSAIAIYPAYAPDLETGDVAVLTLAGDLPLSSAIQPIPLTDTTWRPADGVTTFRLSGWGSTAKRAPDDTTTPQYASPVLMVTDTVMASGQCASAYYPFDGTLLLCAGQENNDACQGDSGGPLAVQIGGVWRLAGLVTGGAGCAWAGYPGFYARTAQAGIHDFLATRGSGSHLTDPTFTRQPAITGDAVPGGILTCDQGEAANAYAYGLGLVRNGILVTRSNSITVNSRDVGATSTCVVVAYGLTGDVQATSPGVTIRALPVAAPAPAPKPAPSPYAPAPDSAPPVAHLVDATCSRRGVCTIGVRVDDPAPSAGVKGVEATVETPYRTTCRVKVKVKGKTKVRRRACTKTQLQRLRAIATPTMYTYKIVTPRLRKGRHTFRLVGVDTAGHRQAKPTTFTKTTR
jgi:secreted trypsin-like serine protease